MIVDDNSLFRHPEFQERSKEISGEVTALESKARDNDLAFVELDGDIGIIGNGAGLVMATLDLVKQYGGKPANFCDVGGGANAEHVATALQIIQGAEKVRAVFVNILAGITRCDEVAKGIAASFVGRELKVLVEKAASANELEKVRKQSWEHGLLRAGTPARLEPSKTYDYFIARTEADAPDIDGFVFVRGVAQTGEFAKVRVIGHTDYDLIAE